MSIVIETVRGEIRITNATAAGVSSVCLPLNAAASVASSLLEQIQAGKDLAPPVDDYAEFVKWFEQEEYCHDYAMGVWAKECVYRAWLARGALS